MGTQDQFVVYPRRWKIVFPLIPCLYLALVGLWMALGQGDALWLRILGWMLALVFGDLTILLLRQLIQPQPLVTISAAGLSSANASVPWQAIQQLRLLIRGRGTFLVADLRDPSLVVRRRSLQRRLMRRLVFRDIPGFLIPLTPLPSEIDLSRLLNEIRRYSDVPFAPGLAETAGVAPGLKGR